MTRSFPFPESAYEHICNTSKVSNRKKDIQQYVQVISKSGPSRSLELENVKNLNFYLLLKISMYTIIGVLSKIIVLYDNCVSKFGLGCGCHTFINPMYMVLHLIHIYDFYCRYNNFQMGSKYSKCVPCHSCGYHECKEFSI